MFSPYVKSGMVVADIGCGMGFNSIGLAKIVGDTGSVIAIDVQRKILNVLEKRAKKAGVIDRIKIYCCSSDSLGVFDKVDFVNAFWMVHEVPNPRLFFKEIYSFLKEGGHLFIAEPRFHVSSKSFDKTLAYAKDEGFNLIGQPSVKFSRIVVFHKC